MNRIEVTIWHDTTFNYLFAGAQALYRLQPDLKDKAVGYVTDLSDELCGKTLEVCLT